jgi:carboxylesterase type B
MITMRSTNRILRTSLDPTRLVAESVKTGKPIIVVTFNYRLNIFAFGDDKGEHNLALQDQRVAIDWVSKHIQQFGGDPVSS